MTKEHRTTEEEMEGPTLFWGSRNRKHAKPFMNMVMMMMMITVKKGPDFKSPNIFLMSGCKVLRS